MIRTQCPKCGSILFDCPNYDSFNRPGNLYTINCRGCGQGYVVSKVGRGGMEVKVRVKGQDGVIPVEYYG